MRRVLERFGPSEIYVEHTNLPREEGIRHYLEFEPSNSSAIVYHASIGTPMAKRLLNLDSPLVIYYHNVTPMHFFVGYEAHFAAQCYAGRSECQQLASRAPLGIAASEFSRRELDTMGYGKTGTIPLLIDFDRYWQPEDRRLARKLEKSKRGTSILFVGRVAPNKRQEDLIKAFSFYKTNFDPEARLILVGHASSKRYFDTLNDFIRYLAVEDVNLVGLVTEPQLYAYYRAADVFVTMSEHEGFCLPVLEAMKFDLPVIAYGAAAVPETVGDAGVVVSEKRFEEIAALMHLVATDEKVRRRLIEAGRKRLEHFQPEAHERRLVEMLEDALGRRDSQKLEERRKML
jgi:glycosyltransferase involved in cell wall biosynthesis